MIVDEIARTIEGTIVSVDGDGLKGHESIRKTGRQIVDFAVENLQGQHRKLLVRAGTALIDFAWLLVDSSLVSRTASEGKRDE